MTSWSRKGISGRTTIEIAKIRSVNGHPCIQDSVRKSKRWISFEMLETLFKGFKKYGDTFIQAAKKPIQIPTDQPERHSGGT